MALSPTVQIEGWARRRFFLTSTLTIRYSDLHGQRKKVIHHPKEEEASRQSVDHRPSCIAHVELMNPETSEEHKRHVSPEQ